MRTSKIISTLLTVLFAGCWLDEAPYQPPIVSITDMQWSDDASSICAIRERPFDSLGFTHWRYYLDQYNRQGTLLNSFPVRYSQYYPIAITADCQHLILMNDTNFVMARFSDSIFKPVIVASALVARSPSAHVYLFMSGDGSGLDDSRITFNLLWIDTQSVRIIRRWQGQEAEFAAYNVLTDSIFSIDENIAGRDFFSIYDTSLRLLYREPRPPQQMMGISYAASIHSVVAARNWNGPSGKVMVIDLITGTSQSVIDWPGIGMSAAPDGFHVAFPYAYDLRVRNLLTGAEKVIANAEAVRQQFSPDGQFVGYTVLYDEGTVRTAAVNGLP